MYIFYPDDQLFVTIYCFLFGIFLAILYDCFKIKHIFFETGLAFTILEDILYFVLCAILFSIGIFNINSGKIRWFQFFPCFLGFAFEKAFFSIYVIKSLRIIADCIRKLKHLILKTIGIILLPLKMILIYLFKPFISAFIGFYLGFYTIMFRSVYRRLYK